MPERIEECFISVRWTSFNAVWKKGGHSLGIGIKVFAQRRCIWAKRCFVYFFVDEPVARERYIECRFVKRLGFNDIADTICVIFVKVLKYRKLILNQKFLLKIRHLMRQLGKWCLRKTPSMKLRMTMRGQVQGDRLQVRRRRSWCDAKRVLGDRLICHVIVDGFQTEETLCC